MLTDLIPSISVRLAGFTILVGCCAVFVSCSRMDHSGRVSETIAHQSSPEAEALWHRNIAASEGNPIRATATIICSKASANTSSAQTVTILDLLEARNGKYRFSYRSPDSARGRVVVCDGKSLWQYEPASKLVVKLAVNSELQAMQHAQSAEDVWIAQIERKNAEQGGRRCDVLLLKNQDGSIVERRWIDRQTARTLRVDEYNGQDEVKRRVELSNISINPSVDKTVFLPAFPDARRIESKARLATNVAAEARQLGLPTSSGFLRLRSIITPRPGRTSSESPIHCVYSYGPRSISVFVSVTGADNKQAVAVAGKGWREVRLHKDVVGSAQDRDNHSAVAWVYERRHYLAVARMPLNQLLPAVDHLSQ